jgi:hypothetical protein
MILPVFHYCRTLCRSIDGFIAFFPSSLDFARPDVGSRAGCAFGAGLVVHAAQAAGRFAADGFER